MQYSSTKWEDNRYGGQRLEDVEYFQSFYPESMKTLRTYVIVECDKMDYPGSPMYDEYPDEIMVHQTCRNICRNIPEEVGRGLRDAAPMYGASCTDNTEVEEVEIYELLQGQQLNQRKPWGPPPRTPWNFPPRPPVGPPAEPPHWGPPPRPPARPPHWGAPPRPPSWGPPPRPHPKPDRPNWMEDIIRILFLNELQRRRCKGGRCF